jgi:uncharacterized protein YecE (DUF72 family)
VRCNSTLQREVKIGTAGWAVPKSVVDEPKSSGRSHLERYADVMNCVEINSTFYRNHQQKTISRWAAAVPEDFRFAVKLSKMVTHEAKLRGCGAELLAFFAQLVPLGEKLGPVLVQLPPKLAFDEGLARDFLYTLRELHKGQVVIEPRHATWFERGSEELLREFEVARAMADPPAGSSAADSPGGWPGLRYYRLHGSPRTYWSQYTDEFLSNLAKTIVAERSSAETWVVFDNTAMNHAFSDAIALRQMLRSLAGSESRLVRSP